MCTATKTPKTRHMECSVCGEYAGKFRQWWNRDTGYGLCARCRDWLTTPDPKTKDNRIRYGAEEMRDLYGEAGTHYPAP